jgi:hypothetical protein
MSKLITPKWLNEGPMDLEYRTYKMLSRVKELTYGLLDNKLLDVLFEVDDTLDYLYRYDAQQITKTQPDDYELMGVGWEDLELV